MQVPWFANKMGTQRLVELTGTNARVYLAPSMSDAGIKLYLYRATLSSDEIRQLKELSKSSKKSTTGLKLLPMDRLLQDVQHGTTLAAVALYGGMPKQRDEEKSIGNVYGITNGDHEEHSNPLCQSDPLLIVRLPQQPYYYKYYYYYYFPGCLYGVERWAAVGQPSSW